MTASSPGESFSASWLALREPVDHRSRAGTLLPPLQAWRSQFQQIDLVDLGAGSGSNFRYLAPRLGGAQRWLLLDHDPRLLALVTSAQSEVTCTTQVFDLRDCAGLPLEGCHLVVASALLDLVSRAWLQELLTRCVEVGAGVLFTLNVDGQVEWQHPDPDDADVAAAFAAHHHRDKGFGPALGAAAGAVLTERLRDAGYQVWVGASPWHLDATDRALYLAWINGWAEAAREQQPSLAARAMAWCRRRQRLLSPVRVGHLDILGLPVHSCWVPNPGTGSGSCLPARMLSRET